MGLQQYDEVKQKVAAIQQRLDNAVREIRDNQSFSESGRRGEMAQAVLQAKKDADSLRDKFIAARSMRRESLQKSLFGDLSTASALDVSNMRDADDRAERLETVDAAQSLLERARDRGDGVLARAVARHAFNRGWRDVIDTYGEQAGTFTRDQLAELSDIPSGHRTNMADDVIFRVRSPQEISSMDSAANIGSYATTDGL